MTEAAIKQTDQLEAIILDTLTLDNYIYIPPIIPGKNLTMGQVMFKSAGRSDIWKDNDKGTLSEREYKLYNDVLHNGYFDDEENGKKVQQGVGGSWYNTFVNMSNSIEHLGHRIHADIFTTVSHRLTGKVIREGLSKQGNVSVIPELPPELQEEVESSASFNFMNELENGELEKKIAAGVGKGNNHLTTEHVRDAFAKKKYNMVFISGNAVEKFGEEVAYAFLEEAKKLSEKGIPVFASYPTKFTPAAKKFFAQLLPIATFTAPNMEEAAKFHDTTVKIENGTGIKEVPDKERTLAAVQKSIDERAHLNPTQTVSDGANGAYGFKANEERVKAPVWNENTKLVEMTGAGDSFAAGVLAMIMAGYDTYKTLKAAMMGGAKFSDIIVGIIGTIMPKHQAAESLDEVIAEEHRWIDSAKSAISSLIKRMTGRGPDNAVAP